MNRIYLVDDQPISNFITKKLLDLEGYLGEVIDFTNPVEALSAVKEDKDALILLDLNMPEMNGWEFLEALKPFGVNHKVIILTSSTSKCDRERVQEFSCVLKYLVKPMNKKKFNELKKFLNLPTVASTRPQ